MFFPSLYSQVLRAIVIQTGEVRVEEALVVREEGASHHVSQVGKSGFGVVTSAASCRLQRASSQLGCGAL